MPRASLTPDDKETTVNPRPTRARSLAFLAAAAIALLACQPEPTDQHLVVGDSLTMTALLAGGFPPDWDIHSMIGWEAEDAQAGVAQRTADAERSPCAAAIALGHNDAADGTTAAGGDLGDGFTSTDVAQLRTLRSSFHPSTEVLWVLPDYTGPVPEYAAGIAAYRSWVTTEAAARGDAVVDWRGQHTAADIEPDGAHLTTSGRLAYGRLITEGMPGCA